MQQFRVWGCGQRCRPLGYLPTGAGFTYPYSHVFYFLEFFRELWWSDENVLPSYSSLVWVGAGMSTAEKVKSSQVRSACSFPNSQREMKS